MCLTHLVNTEELTVFPQVSVISLKELDIPPRGNLPAIIALNDRTQFSTVLAFPGKAQLLCICRQSRGCGSIEKH